jgi:nicotinamidase-related amidase
MPLRPHGFARNGIARRRIGGNNMANLKFDKEITALLVIDPYNDFISEGGKMWDRVRAVAEANAARNAGFASSIHCIVDNVQATTEAGNSSPLSQHRPVEAHRTHVRGVNGSLCR